MSAALNPITTQRLAEFRRRRNQLAMSRGWSAVALVFVCSLIVAVLIDGLLPFQWARWIASTVVYAATATAWYQFCWKLSRSKPSLTKDAQRLEELDPRLREQLLAAVEFAEDSKDKTLDSSAFKSSVQEQVAKLIAPVDVRQLLPWQLVRRWLAFACVAVALMLLLGFVPRLHWMNRVARALLPAANLDRVGSVSIVIESPQPNSKTIAADDIVGIIARIDGPLPKQVTLESRTTKGNSTVPMQPQAVIENPTNNESESQNAYRFHATLNTEEAWVEYRVAASGGATAWHRLTTRPRPHVEQFEIQSTPPSYTQCPATHQTSEDGHLRALVGTHVQLSLKLNQSVKVAELRWQSDAESNSAPPLPLTYDAKADRYTVDFEVVRHATYRIHLESSEGGLANDFSPTYRVEAVVDQPPATAWTKPSAEKQIVAPGDLLSLAASVQDELPIDSLLQAFRINRADSWQVLNVEASRLSPSKQSEESPSPSLERSTVTEGAWPWDLLTLSLRAGDSIESKLIAKDRKGQESESPVIEFLVSEASIAKAATEAEGMRQHIASELEQFEQAIEAIDRPLQEFAKRKPTEQSPEQRAEESQQYIDSALAMEKLIQEEAPKLLQLVEHAAREEEDTGNLLQLELLGQWLSSMQTRSSREIKLLADELADAKSDLPAKQRSEMERELAQQSQRTAHGTEFASQSFRAMTSQDVGRRMIDSVAQLEQLFNHFVDNHSPSEPKPNADQSKQADPKRNPEVRAEQQRREAAVLASQLADLQQTMLDAIPTVRQDTKGRLRQSADSLGNLVNQLENAIGQTDPVQLQNAAQQIARALSHMKSPAAFDGGLHDAVVGGQRRLAEMNGQASDQLRRAITNWTNPEGRQGLDVRAASVDSAVQQIDDRRNLLRARREADRQFASDLGNAARAIRSIQKEESLSKSDQQKALTETSSALQSLQAMHGIEEAEDVLDELLRGERWAINSSDARIQHPLLFDTFGERLESAVRLLREAQAPNELVGDVERLRWHESTGKAGQKLGNRRWENNQPVSAAAELSQVSEMLAAAKARLEPFAESARSQLANHAPSLSELASDAAEAARELQQDTKNLAEAIQRDEVPDQAAQVAQLESKQTFTMQPIAELRDALVDHADAQNLLKEKELRSAREADAAIAVVDHAQQQIDLSMQPTASSDAQKPDSQNPSAQDLAEENRAEQNKAAPNLAQAAETQSRAADELEQLAKHFAQNVEGEHSRENPTSPNSQSVMDLAKELGENDEAQKRFNEAAQLARLAAAKPEEVLRQLEQKLADNRPMQQEMSRISQELAEQALNRLDRAASQQNRIQPALESSDPRFQAKKQLMLHDLQSVRNDANQMLDQLVSEAKWTAGAGKEEPQQKQLEQVERELRSALQATQDANMERTYDQLREETTELAKTLAAAQKSLNETSQKLSEASSHQVHSNDAELANRRREMQDRQRRIAQQQVRSLEQSERTQQQLMRQADNESKQAAQREKSLEQHRNNISKEVAKHPDNASLKQQLADAERNLALGQLQKQAAEQTKEQAAKRVEAAAQLREKAKQRTVLDLNSVNPSAQLASETAKVSAERTVQLAAQLSEWSSDAASQSRPEAGLSQLQNSLQDQRSIERSVADSAEDLARAARHEQRLKSEKASQSLAAQSDAVEKLNQAEVAQSESAIESALNDSKRAESPTGQASTSATQAANQNAANATQAIREQADDLRQMLADVAQRSAAQMAEANSPANRSSQAPNQNANASASSLLDAKQLAQLLDEIDRQLNRDAASESSASQQAQQAASDQQANSQQSPSQQANSQKANSQQASTLSSAAEQIASQLSRNRQPAPESQQSMATDSKSANVEPQAPVAVKILEVNRVGADWGKLREQAASDMIESKRESVSSAYRRQIEAYFRSIAERSQAAKQ